jgi:hypothetical protein
MADPTERRGEEWLREPPASAGVPDLARRAPVARRAGSSRRVLLAAVAAVAIVLAAAVTVALTRRPRGAGAPESAGSVTGGQLLAPLRAERDGTGEEVAPFSEFAVSVETDPPGALVTVAGLPRGEAPVFAGVECAPGDRIEVRAERPGWAPASRETICRNGALVRLRLELPRK